MRYNDIRSHRLDELQGYRQSDEFQAFQSLLGSRPDEKNWGARSGMLDDFVDFLRQKGFSALGKGAFGAVFEHPQLDYAIKIFRNDPAYLSFAKFAQQNQSNPYLPKFRGRFMKLDRNNFVVRMEKLDVLPFNSDQAEMIQRIVRAVREEGAESYLETCRSFYEEPSEHDMQRFAESESLAKQAQRDQDQALRDFMADGSPSNQQAYESAVQRFQAAARDYRSAKKLINRSNWQMVQMKFCIDNPLFCSTIEQISKMAGRGFRVDMHSGNFLLRGEQPVITDPLASSNYI